MSDEETRAEKEATERQRVEVGLCRTCRFMRLIESERGSKFYQCQRSATDPSFPKYPRLPVLQCRGYEADTPAVERRG